MLERFKVPLEDEVRVDHESLQETVVAIFEKMGVEHDDAVEGANCLVSTDLRGVETHGVSNMLRIYVDMFNKGQLSARPDWKIVKEFPGTATIDADRGLAVILGPKAMRLAIEKARRVGVGVVTMFNAGHSGAIGHHAMLAAEADMVGMTATAGGKRVLPTFGAEPRLGTNPIAIAAPARSQPYLLFDAATSAVAGNKLALASRVDANMLPGWIAERDGSPIMEETSIPSGYNREQGEEWLRNHYQLPLGGTREQGSHKGYGFGLMAEVLATSLTGVTPSMLDSQSSSGHHYFCAYNIEAFTDLETFKDNMDKMLQMLKDTKPASGHERVLYPGLSEYEEEKDRRANGIPLHKEVIEWFEFISNELAVPALKTI